MNPASNLIADFVKDQAKAATVLDSAEKKQTSDAGADYANADIALKAVAAVQEWAETQDDDLDDGETLADRLFSLLAGIADANMDGEVGEDEQEVFFLAADAAANYLASKGIADDDAISLLEDFDVEVAQNVHELLISALPNGEEEAAADMDAFVFGDGSDESALDAVYKKRIAFRGGRKVMIKKRISGKVRLSAKQKVGIRKMLRKSHSAAAQMRRAKSMRLRAKAGL
jgi:hypothetical protein